MTKNITYILSISLVLLSCGTFTFNDRKEAKLVASIGNEKLYLGDVVGLNLPDLTKEDSSLIIKNYAEYWLMTRAVEEYSKVRYSSKSDEIDKLIEEYKRSLFTEFFEKEHTKNLSDYVSSEEIDEYYKANKQKYIVTSNLVKAQVMTLPKGYKDATLLKKKFTSGKRDDFEDILSIAERDNFIIKDYSQAWIYFNDLSKYVSFKGDVTKFLKSKAIFEAKDDNFVYFLKINDYKLIGDVTPKELVTDLITRAIIINRRKNRVQQVRDSIYNDAVVQGKAVIKYD